MNYRIITQRMPFLFYVHDQCVVDAFHFDTDPDPGSALNKMDLDPGHKHFFYSQMFIRKNNF